MKKSQERVLAAVLIAVMNSPVSTFSLVQADTTTSTEATTGITITAHRIAGVNRYATANALSEKFSSADTVIIASGDNFPDALCAAPLAKKYNAPILLSSSAGLSSTTLAEITRLKATKAIIIGGKAAVTAGVETQLTSQGVTPTRLQGKDRYETSLLVAKQLDKPTAVVVAYGEDFPDALSISAIASQLNMPIILSSKDGLSADAKTYIKNSGATKTYLIGGTGVLSEKVDAEVANPVRLAGADRYATDLKVLSEFSSKLNYDTVYLATGEDFADALSGAAVASKTTSPIVLVASDIDTNMNKYLQGHVTLNTKAVALGGNSVVADSLVGKVMDDKANVTVAKVYSTAGNFTGDTINGSAIISAAGVNLKNTTIAGDLLIASTVGDGDIDLDNVTVKGKIIVNGGGSHCIRCHNMSVDTASLDKALGEQVKIITDATSSIECTSIESNGNVDALLAKKPGKVVVSQGASATFSGNFDVIEVAGRGAKLNIENAKVATLDVKPEAKGTAISTSPSTTITTLNVNASMDMTGAAVVTNANIGANGVVIDTKPTNVSMVKGVESTIGGEKRNSQDGKTKEITTIPTASNPTDPVVETPVTPVGPPPVLSRITGTIIAGITPPVTGESPITTATATSEYTATVTWSGTPTTFAANTVYTATITITPKTGYTLTGVTANQFTVPTATNVTNAINSGVVTAVFPATASDKTAGAATNLAKITDEIVKTLPFGTANTKVDVEAAMLTLANKVVDPAYTVTMASGSTYDTTTNAWVGKFVVTNKTTATDTKTDATNRNITIAIAPNPGTVPADNTDITDKFTDANFKNRIYPLIHKTSGSPILYSDVKDIKTLNLNVCNISSLSGIEYFTALTHLECMENKLTTLDLSKNTALTYLDCGGNIGTNQITSLDLSKNTALTHLDCWDNKLTALDLTNNTALTYLNCGGNAGTNQLAALDVSKNTALTKLLCDNNKLTTLDVSNNTALTELRCWSNQLTTLDVSKHTALTYLDCSNNQLTSLDISKNNALTSLNCGNNQLTSLDVSKNTALTILNCGPNKLTTLDISKNTALTHLGCYGNKLTTLDIGNNTALTTFDCGNNQLTSLDVSKHTALTTLGCNSNQLTSLDVSNNKALINFRCGNNKLTTLDIGNNTRLTTLDCNGNPITTLNISKNIALTTLICYFNQLTALDISKNTALTELRCWNNQLTTLDISKNTALTTLDCSNNQLITLDLSKNAKLTTLVCSDNKLTTLDISKNTALTTFDCRYNELKTLYSIKNTWTLYNPQYTDSTRTTTNNNLVITKV